LARYNNLRNISLNAHALWKMESVSRVESTDILSIDPAAGGKEINPIKITRK
jgi:hypothetical protein